MKYLAFILLCFFGLFVKPPFKVDHAEMQKSYGGLPEVPVVTTYQFEVTAKADSDILKFNKLWVKNKSIDLISYRVNEVNQMIRDFNKGDKILVEGFLRSDNTINIDAPIDYNGECLIEYTIKGKKQYLVIEEIEKLPDLYHP